MKLRKFIAHEFGQQTVDPVYNDSAAVTANDGMVKIAVFMDVLEERTAEPKGPFVRFFVGGERGSLMAEQ